MNIELERAKEIACERVLYMASLIMQGVFRLAGF